MSKKVRKLHCNSSATSAKRRCSASSRRNCTLQSESVLWPEEEESFFSNSKLGNLLDINEQGSSHGRSDKDESLFGTSKLEVFARNDVQPTLFQSENNVSPKEETFLSHSTLDFLMRVGGDSATLADQYNGRNISQHDSADGSFLSVSAVAHLLSNSQPGLFESEGVNLFQDATEAHKLPESQVTPKQITLKDEDICCGRAEPKFHANNADDSVFSSITLPAAEENGSQFQLKIDDTLFSHINFDEVASEESEPLSTEEAVVMDVGLQNTQRFLDDVATFKMPQTRSAKHPAGSTHLEPAQKPLLDITMGSQYACHENLVNCTMLNNLEHLNWETEAFPELVTGDTFPSKGDFYGLPDKVKQLIFEHKGIKSLYEWQDECLSLPAIHKRKNLIYALPTSGGKTLVAEILMLREVLCRKKDVLFVLPYVSIVQEKVSAMSPFAIALDFIVDEYTAGKGKCPPTKRKKRKSIFIASIEKGAVLMDTLIETQRADEIGLVVIDELHLIGEKGRGATLEALLTKIMFLEANIQIVGMSATIGNLSEVSAFLKADVYTRGFRPVELKEYIKCGNDILAINPDGKTLEEVFLYTRSVNFKYSESVARMDPDHLAGLVTECAPENCCLIFCPSRKNCENVALLLSRILPKAKFLDHRKSEKADLMDALDKICGVLSPVLAKTIPYGVAYHHSGLTIDERKFIEAAYRFGVLSVICCTSTLAAGVNLPAKRVIIRAPYVGADFMTLCKYKQMVGRAGRAGMGAAGESILIASSQDNVRVGEMLFSPMDKALSSLGFQDYMGLQSLILSAIGLELAACRIDLYKLVNSTLLAVQAEHLGISTEQQILNIIREMFKHKVLRLCSLSSKRHCSGILTTQDVKDGASPANISQRQSRCIYISKSTRFQLTTIGKAAFKAGIDYKRAYVVHNELKFAQQHLILCNYAHLLYLAVSFNSNAKGDELFTADAGILFREYTTLDDTTQSLFRLLGFTEAHAAKVAKTLSIQGAMELKLNRLYKVLILVDILNVVPLPAVAAKYNIERGMLQNLVSQTTSAASAIVRLCEQLEEFWCYKPLFERLSAKMDRCGTIELEPLLDLPAVKINRARQFYAAGYRTLEDIAKCRPTQLARTVEHMSLKVANEIISAAKIILMKKLDHLEEETEALKLCLNQNNS